MGKQVLLHLVLIAAAADLLWGIIPNGLVAAGLLCGLCDQVYGWKILGFALWGLGIAVPIFLFGGLYWFRMIGAGDVKLFCVIGGFLGPGSCLWCVIYSILFGGVISAILVVKRRNVFARLFYFRNYITEGLKTRQWRPYCDGDDESGQFCFSVPILMGLIFTLGGAV